jgi:hypothetical protein
MWVLPKIDAAFIAAMEHVLALYALPYNPKEPLLCFDEKSIQLIEETRKVIETKAGKPRKRDYEYKRNGTRNIFLVVEPKAGWRSVKATARRTKHNFAKEIARIEGCARYTHAKKIHVVLDNLNTHGEHSLVETFGKKEAKRLMKRIVFHHTPKHASWLDMAEIELSILTRQALGRIGTKAALRKRLSVWSRDRNRKKATIT